MTGNKNNIGRRKYLHAISAASSLLVAGCSSSGTQSTANESTDGSNAKTTAASQPLQDVYVKDSKLQVEITTDTVAEKINVIDPNGKQFKTRSLSAGVTTVSFNLTRGYTPGEHKVVAATLGETLQTETLSINPQLEIIEISVAEDNPELDWDKDSNYWKNSGSVKVKNTGTGPKTVTNLLFKGTPQPTPDEHENLRDHDKVTINPGEEIILYADEKPFHGSPQGYAVCGAKSDAEVILESPTGEDVTKSFSWNTEGDAEYIISPDCNVSIEE